MHHPQRTPRVKTFTCLILAAAVSVGIASTANAQAPASATGSRTPASDPPAPVLTPKRSFDSAPAVPTTPTPSTPAAAPAATAPAAAAPAAAPMPAQVIIPTELDTKECIARLRPGAVANGVSLEDYDRFTKGATLLPTTVASAKGQPEGRESWWDYIAKTVDEERVRDGAAVLKRYGKELAKISQTYQVDPATLVAIFGIETNFGSQVGKTNVLDAWLTRACTENKPLWIKNAYASVRLLRDGIVPADNFVGSWSGAFGMTQFIPTSFYELAADGDGDGRIDLYNSLPDALASTANHLRKRRAKWTHGLPAVIEVSLPESVANAIPKEPTAEFINPQDSRTLAQWAQAGVTRADGPKLKFADASDQKAYVFAPTGQMGPTFLVTGNFDAILHYNQSRRYALAVSLLLNRLQGEGALHTAWPTDDPGLSRAEVKELQTLLAARGHDVGVADGIPGGKTRDAVGVEQARLGLPIDGRVGQRILKALRSGGVSAAPSANDVAAKAK